MIKFLWSLTLNKQQRLRYKHINDGHPHDKSVLIDKLTSEKHPHTNDEFIYTVNIMKCKECGLNYNDCGLEFREPIK